MANRKKTKGQNHTQKTKDRATRTPLTTGMNFGASEGYQCVSNIRKVSSSSVLPSNKNNR
jgi:hypothetical protein